MTRSKAKLRHWCIFKIKIVCTWSITKSTACNKSFPTIHTTIYVPNTIYMCFESREPKQEKKNSNSERTRKNKTTLSKKILKINICIYIRMCACDCTRPLLFAHVIRLIRIASKVCSVCVCVSPTLGDHAHPCVHVVPIRLPRWRFSLTRSLTTGIAKQKNNNNNKANNVSCGKYVRVRARFLRFFSRILFWWRF